TKQLSALRGAARRWPAVGIPAAVGALALAGVAPLSLWATKDEVLAAARDTSPLLYVVGLAAAALSAAYAGKALLMVWRRAPDGVEDGYDTEERGTRHVGVLQKAPLTVLAVGATTLGVLALPPVGARLRRALGEESMDSVPTAGPVQLVVSAVLALAVLTAVSRWSAPEPRWAQGWLGLERTAHLVVVQPVLWLADVLARFDDRGVDAAVTGTARGGLRAGDAAARADVAGVDAMVEAVARGARRLGSLARIPQTGQLHQYYAQAAVLLAAAVLLLLVVR
ncbi:MAG: NADH-quinone oxidoreductase subunit L, partial [Actinomycetota bacterium]|nr:NADH-quinone oxidoreductase subunit L [Actinomycetota bacterium]